MLQCGSVFAVVFVCEWVYFAVKCVSQGPYNTQDTNNYASLAIHTSTYINTHTQHRNVFF